jgi:hypothetical protein
MCRFTGFLLGCCVLAAAVLTFATGPAFAGNVVTFSDDTFSDSNWSATKCWDTAGGQSFQAYQNIAGGNPNAYRFVSESTTGGAENVAHIYLGGTYNPHTQGSISDLDWGFDAKLISPPGKAGLGAWFILEQGADSSGHPVIFQSNAIQGESGYSSITSGNWTTFHEELMNASCWTSNQSANPGAPLNPDFSTDGGVISFGFETSSSPGSNSDLTYSAGFDNWYVDITGNVSPAPEPMTLTLLAAGGLMISRRRSRVS